MESSSSLTKDGLPSISVVIPCFNQGPYLAEAISSALAQTHPPLEVIVVDDGSSDDSVEVAQSFGPPVRVVQRPNGGPSAARNTGVEAATGEIVAFLDGDDLMRNDCLAARAELLASDGTAGMVIGDLRLVDIEGKPIGKGSDLKPPEVTHSQALREMSCPTCGLLVKRSVYQECGGFDPALRIGEDSDLLVRITRKYRCLVDPEPRADYRQVGGSLSRDYVLWFDSFRKVFRKNRLQAENKFAYWRDSTIGMMNLTCDRVFGKMLKDPTRGSFAKELFKVISKRPVLAFYFVFWAFRIVFNRILWLFGRGPLKAARST